MTMRDEERRLRRAIAAGAGLAEARRLVELLEAKADVQVARVRVPKAWRDLMKKRLPSGAPFGTPDDLEDPAPRQDDFRAVHVQFPDGSWAKFFIASACGEGGRYGCAVDLYHPGSTEPFYEHPNYERSIPDEFVVKHGDKTYVLELE